MEATGRCETSRITTEGRWHRRRVGRCVDAEGAPAYWPWRQVLRSLGVDPDTLLAGDVDECIPNPGRQDGQISVRLPGERG